MQNPDVELEVEEKKPNGETTTIKLMYKAYDREPESKAQAEFQELLATIFQPDYLTETEN